MKAMENKKEPLMSAEDLLIKYHNNSKKDWLFQNREVVSKLMKEYTQWHLNNAKEFVADEAICKHCGGNGYIVEVEAECCCNFDKYNGCCNVPNPVQVQKQCYCFNGVIPLDKQSIHTAIDNYIEINLNKEL